MKATQRAAWLALALARVANAAVQIPYNTLPGGGKLPVRAAATAVPDPAAGAAAPRLRCPVSPTYASLALRPGLTSGAVPCLAALLGLGWQLVVMGDGVDWGRGTNWTQWLNQVGPRRCYRQRVGLWHAASHPAGHRAVHRLPRTDLYHL